MAQILLDSRTLQRGYFRPDYVRSLLQRHRAGREDLSRRILTLVILEIWHRTFVDGICMPIRDLDSPPRVTAASA